MRENNSDKNSSNRRRVLKSIGAISATSAFGIGNAAAKKNGKNGTKQETKIEKVETEASAAQATSAVQSGPASDLVAVFEEFTATTDSASMITMYVDDQEFSRLVSVPTSVGTLQVSYEGGSAASAVVQMSGESLSASAKTRLSGAAGWPADTSGALISYGNGGSPKFIRDVTDSEEATLTALTGKKSEPISIGVRTTVDDSQDASYVVAYEDEEYTMSLDLGTVESTAVGGGGMFTKQSCVDKAGLCLIDIVMASPHCGLAGLACSITGPASIGCVTIVLGMCLPNVALIYVSGNCSYVALNCL